MQALRERCAAFAKSGCLTDLGISQLRRGNRSLAVAARLRHRMFAVTYRAATARERSTGTNSSRSVKRPDLAARSSRIPLGVYLLRSFR